MDLPALFCKKFYMNSINIIANFFFDRIYIDGVSELYVYTDSISELYAYIISASELHMYIILVNLCGAMESLRK